MFANEMNVFVEVKTICMGFKSVAQWSIPDDEKVGVGGGTPSSHDVKL
ncbi:hypothetical protein QW180_19065 [Vibrio sinaloensis]|nr:hypothetical protein [Vibrio sinaloensis]